MPGADYISSNVTEVERAGQDMGSILNRLSVELIYDRDTAVPGNLRYLLHTEPAIPRRGQHGSPAVARPRTKPVVYLKSRISGAIASTRRCLQHGR